MTTPLRVTGLQIAILVGLTQGLVAIGTYYLERELQWPKEHSSLLGHALLFPLAGALFLLVPALRKFAHEELARPVPPALRMETLVVGFAKTSIPFGVAGATVLYYWVIAPDTDLRSVMALARDPAAVTRNYWTFLGIVYAIGIVMLLGPLIEELVFRGLLYRTWEQQWGWVPATLATSACFAIVHPSRMVQAFIGSVVFICLLRRTGTIRAPIYAHMIYNALVTWPLLGHILFAKPLDQLHRAGTWAIEFFCLPFLVIALPVYLWMSQKPHQDVEPRIG